MQKLMWPASLAFVAALAAVVLILIFVPASNPTGAQAVVSILAMLGSALGSMFVVAHVRAVRNDVKEVKDQVNGRMTQLIEAATVAQAVTPEPEVPPTGTIPQEGTP